MGALLAALLWSSGVLAQEPSSEGVRTITVSETQAAEILITNNRLGEWTVNFAFALAPDSNQNAATSANQVNIFGLPFALDNGARKQSGIGAAGYIGGEWSPLLDDNVKVRIGANLYRVDYSGG